MGELPKGSYPISHYSIVIHFIMMFLLYVACSTDSGGDLMALKTIRFVPNNNGFTTVFKRYCPPMFPNHPLSIEILGNEYLDVAVLMLKMKNSYISIYFTENISQATQQPETLCKDISLK